MRTTQPQMVKSNRRAVEAQVRVRKMLDVAARLMVRHGYQHTSLDDILRLSGGSKATLIKYFRNKAGLLAAVFSVQAERCIAAAHAAAIGEDPELALQTFGEVMLRFYLQRDSVVIYRGVISEGSSRPLLARTFYEQGHARIVAALSSRLANWGNALLIACGDPDADADRFLHLIRGGCYEKRLIGLVHEVSAQEIGTTVTGAVQLFLYGVLPRGLAGRRAATRS